MNPTVSGPAETLHRLYLTLRPEPLLTKDEFSTYYRSQVNRVRGMDTVARLSLKLQQSFGAVPFRTFLMGHPGVGKSTEITRLLERVKDQHIGIRLSIATELNPASFKVFDVLLLMLVRIAEEANSLGVAPLDTDSAALIADLLQWFGTKKESQTRTAGSAASVDVGIGAKWLEFLGFSVSAKAEAKYAAERKTETIEHSLQRLPDLIGLCNRLIDACSRKLREKTGKEWLLIVEDLDKTGISPQQLQELFIQYGNVFEELRVSMIFTIPVWLAYSDDANRLPFERYMIHDTPVFDQGHDAHVEGRAAVEAVLTARVAPSLFAEGQMTRLIVASGGNLRDLFELVLNAGEGALSRDPDAITIGPDDVTAAINQERRDYRMKLGQSPYDALPISYEQKMQKLVAVYQNSPGNDLPDAALYSLLRARAVQEFNGTGWFGVHPLAVDILRGQQLLTPDAPGGSS